MVLSFESLLVIIFILLSYSCNCSDKNNRRHLTECLLGASHLPSYLISTTMLGGRYFVLQMRKLIFQGLQQVADQGFKLSRSDCRV